MATARGRSRSRPSDIEAAWHVIDAEGKTLGRVSSEIAVLLQGKHKTTYVPYLNTGDFVVVVNAEKVRVTGNKLEDKRYYRHSGYHGGLTERKLSDLLRTFPTRVIKQAVKGMLPKNTVGRHMLSRLKLYAGESHPHSAQINAGARRRGAAEAAEAKAATRPAAARRAASKKPEAEAEVEEAVTSTAPAETPTEAPAEEKPKPRQRPRAAAEAAAGPTAEADAPQEATAGEAASEEQTQEKPRRRRATSSGSRATSEGGTDASPQQPDSEEA